MARAEGVSSGQELETEALSPKALEILPMAT